MKCQARQYSDQKYCDRCGLTWDMNDPEPPKCIESKLYHVSLIRGTHPLLPCDNLQDLVDYFQSTGIGNRDVLRVYISCHSREEMAAVSRVLSLLIMARSLGKVCVSRVELDTADVDDYKSEVANLGRNLQ
jgi:hypothetical protein